jgi:hypothetical protein
MNLRKFSPDPIINRLTFKYEIDDSVVVILCEDGNYLIPEPYLTNLRANPWICSMWAEQEMQDAITFEAEDLSMMVHIIKEHGYKYVLLAYTDTHGSNFYEPSQN